MFTDSEAIALCTLIAGFDNRFDNDKPARAAWKVAANAQGWTFPDAATAVTRFYTRPRDADEGLPRIAPGHITTLIRGSRPGTASAPPLAQVLGESRRELTVGRPSTAEHRAALRAELDAQLQAQRGDRKPLEGRKPWHEGPVVRDLDEVAVEEGGRMVRALLSGPRAAHAAASRAVPSP